jgi:hypothetical protein
VNEKAVIDRFEGDQAVLLVGEKEVKLIVGRGALPLEAKEGDWLQIEAKAGALLRAELDPEETAARRARIAEKLEALRRGEQLN